VILLVVLVGAAAAVIFLAPDKVPEGLRDKLKSLGVPIKMPAEAEEEEGEAEEPAETEESAEPATEETDDTSAAPAKADPVASTSAEESEGLSAREAIPGVGDFGIKTRPDLSGGGPAVPKVSTGDEIE
jgi:Sec-independent protein translocase protein TatA